MKEVEVADIIIQWLISKQYPIYLNRFAGAGMDEADVLGINKSGYSVEFEIKLSRSDYKADFIHKKYKHRKLKERIATKTYQRWINRKEGKRGDHIINLIPNRFYYVCPKDMIRVEEVPEYAGLIYFEKRNCWEMKNAPLLHKIKPQESMWKRIATILSFRMVHGSEYLRHKHIPKLKRTK